jgi:predicted ABC-type ATPase
MSGAPGVVVIGGPNGAGKTTISREYIAETLGVAEFVNADFIAKGLSGFEPDRSALPAGRIMLARLRELAAARADFAFETTLASRTFAPWLAELIASGYEFHLAFVWLNSSELAIRRVNRRVRDGGHFVPPDTVRRRYSRGIANFIHLYMPLASRWRVYDNSGAEGRIVAFKRIHENPRVIDPRTWSRILEIANDQTHQDDRRDL